MSKKTRRTDFQHSVRRVSLFYVTQNFALLFQFIRVLCQLQKAVKVALEQLVLHDAVFLKLALGKRLGNLVCHPATIL